MFMRAENNLMTYNNQTVLWVIWVATYNSIYSQEDSLLSQERMD